MMRRNRSSSAILARWAGPVGVFSPSRISAFAVRDAGAQIRGDFFEFRSGLLMRMCRLVDKPGTGRAIGFPPALADDR
jgi:hypothetical protein